MDRCTHTQTEPSTLVNIDKCSRCQALITNNGIIRHGVY